MSRLKRLLEKQSFRYLALEFLIIFSSVLIAFTLNNWSERQKNNQVKDFYLQELSDNLDADIRNLEEVVAQHIAKLSVLDSLLLKLPKAMEKDHALLNQLFVKQIGNNTFFPNQGAYKAMLSEGSLDLISDKNLLTSIISLYEKDYTRVVNFGTILDKVVEQSTWEEKAYFSFHQLQLRAFAELDIPHLMSILEHQYAYAQQYLSIAKVALEKANELKGKIKKA